jgi:hypothetical protein
MENLDQIKKNLDWLAGQPIQICYKMTRKRPCTQSEFAKKKNSTNTHKIELRQAPSSEGQGREGVYLAVNLAK